jgi:hypothetical protein
MWVALHVVALAAAGPSGLDPAAVGLSEAALLKAAAEVARVAPIRCVHAPPPAHTGTDKRDAKVQLVLYHCTWSFPHRGHDIIAFSLVEGTRAHFWCVR